VWVGLAGGLLGSAASRQAAGVVSPALDATPAPNSRPAELADRSWETRPSRENVHSLCGESEPLRDVDGDHELGACIHSQESKRTSAVDLTQ
jgi:hypothetical protein